MKLPSRTVVADFVLVALSVALALATSNATRFAGPFFLIDAEPPYSLSQEIQEWLGIAADYVPSLILDLAFVLTILSIGLSRVPSPRVLWKATLGIISLKVATSVSLLLIASWIRSEDVAWSMIGDQPRDWGSLPTDFFAWVELLALVQCAWVVFWSTRLVRLSDLDRD